MSSSSGNEEDSEAEWEELDASQREGEAAAAVVLSTCVICTCSMHLVAVLGDLPLSVTPPTTSSSSSSQAALEIVLTKDDLGKKR